MNSRVGGKESVDPGLRAFRRSTPEEVNKINLCEHVVSYTRRCNL